MLAADVVTAYVAHVAVVSALYHNADHPVILVVLGAGAIIVLTAFSFVL